ncbi:MAG: ATP-binding cassette domain-containing protein [Clostridia bacterium]|nr:ATP-binding cassette domain-containing protein [Clostridia bacterium]
MSIILEDVQKSFSGKQVIRNASVTIGAGERVCFFGPSGCGKTTMLRLICGLEQPDKGSIRLPDGLRWSCHFQEDRLLPWYTSAENIALVTKDDPAIWLEQVHLREAWGLYPDELSGGMRRRVSLARALAHESDALVLDEPLRELDAATAKAMLQLIDISINGRTLLLVTHDPSQAEALHCRMIAMPL